VCSHPPKLLIVERLDSNGLTEQEFLNRYHPGDYPRPSVTADVVVLALPSASSSATQTTRHDLPHVLLIRRGAHPYIGHWALPGGFVNPDETVGAAARRELEEEAGIQPENLVQLFTFSTPGRDPRTWIITVAHMAIVTDEHLAVRAGDDAEDAQWFAIATSRRNDVVDITLTHADLRLSTRLWQTGTMAQAPDGEAYAILTNDGLAFDHAKIIACALQKLGMLD